MNTAAVDDDPFTFPVKAAATDLADPFGTAPAPVVAKTKKAKASTAPVSSEAQPYTGPIEFVIFGQPASKANSRKIVTIAGRPQIVKSKEALAFETAALRQIPPKARLQLTCPVKVTLRMFYESERPDLDESIVLDVLQSRFAKQKIPGREEQVRVLIQAGVYVNDRQVREKHVYHAIDKLMPRVEIRVESLSPQETLL